MFYLLHYGWLLSLWSRLWKMCHFVEVLVLLKPLYKVFVLLSSLKRLFVEVKKEHFWNIGRSFWTLLIIHWRWPETTIYKVISNLIVLPLLWTIKLSVSNYSKSSSSFVSSLIGRFGIAVLPFLAFHALPLQQMMADAGMRVLCSQFSYLALQKYRGKTIHSSCPGHLCHISLSAFSFPDAAKSGTMHNYHIYLYLADPLMRDSCSTQLAECVQRQPALLNRS